MSRFSLVVFSIAASSAAACGGKQTKVKAKAPMAMTKAKPAMKQAAASPKEIVEASPNLGVAAEVIDECTVQIADLGKAPKFDYDDTDLLSIDREILDRIATCVVSGPLSGRQLQLVGRADPRGSQEYNLGLGTKRAKTVSTYLLRVGVPGTQISITTRGDLDAAGRDETTWRGDRRVDMELAPTAAAAAPDTTEN